MATITIQGATYPDRSTLTINGVSQPIVAGASYTIADGDTIGLSASYPGTGSFYGGTLTINGHTYYGEDATLNISNEDIVVRFGYYYDERARAYSSNITINYTETTIDLDLSTIGLSEGTHLIQMALSDDGLTKPDSELSNAVSYTISPAPSGYNLEFSFQGGDNSGDMVVSDDEGTLLTLSSDETATIVYPAGTLYVNQSEGGTPQNTWYAATGGIAVEELGEATFRLTITGDGTFDAYWTGCFAEGTLITLADGSQKPVEDIVYNDDLLVWNFYDGKFDSAKPMWIMPVKQSRQYNKLTFDNGAELKLIGAGGLNGYHRIYNDNSKCFTHTGIPETPIGCQTFTDHGEFVKLISQEIVDDDVKYYNIITKKHYNLFTNGILTSCRLSNQYAIEDMKYVGESKLTEKEISAYISNLPN